MKELFAFLFCMFLAFSILFAVGATSLVAFNFYPVLGAMILCVTLTIILTTPLIPNVKVLRIKRR